MSLNGQQYAWRRMPSRWYTSCSDWVESARLLPPDVFSLVTSSYRDTMRQVLPPPPPSSVIRPKYLDLLLDLVQRLLALVQVHSPAGTEEVVGGQSAFQDDEVAFCKPFFTVPSAMARGETRERENVPGTSFAAIWPSGFVPFLLFFFSPQVRVLRAGFDQLRWVLLAGVTGVC